MRRTPLSIVLVAACLLAGCSPLSVLSTLSTSSHFERFPDIAYGELDRQALDVYRPVGSLAAAPVVVYFYGGAWRNGDKAEFRFVASSLSQAGFVVVIPDYRLYPEVGFPEFVEDGAAAVAWAVENARRFGGDAGKLYLMGHSAGAHIAALLAYDQRYLAAQGLGPGSVAGLIGLSGPYDFLPIDEGYLDKLFPEDRRADSQPINFVSEDSPRTLLIHGGDDDIVEAGNSERLAGRLMAHGVSVTLRSYAGVGHGRVVVALAPPLDFIAATLDDCIAFVESGGASGEAVPET
jgi:acetyl esterase/lipase